MTQLRLSGILVYTKGYDGDQYAGEAQFSETGGHWLQAPTAQYPAEFTPEPTAEDLILKWVV